MTDRSQKTQKCVAMVDLGCMCWTSSSIDSVVCNPPGFLSTRLDSSIGRIYRETMTGSACAFIFGCSLARDSKRSLVMPDHRKTWSLMIVEKTRDDSTLWLFSVRRLCGNRPLLQSFLDPSLECSSSFPFLFESICPLLRQ